MVHKLLPCCPVYVNYECCFCHYNTGQVSCNWMTGTCIDTLQPNGNDSTYIQKCSLYSFLISRVMSQREQASAWPCSLLFAVAIGIDHSSKNVNHIPTTQLATVSSKSFSVLYTQQPIFPVSVGLVGVQSSTVWCRF